MKYKPDETTLISYMYGELGEKEKERVQAYFQENPEELKQMQQLVGVLGALGKVSDKEVIAPPIFMDDNKIRPLWRTTYFKAIASIAASFLLVAVAARLLITEVSYSQGELRVSFAGVKREVAEPPVRKELSESEVQKMIDVSLQKNGEAINVRLAESQKKLDAVIRKNLDANSRQFDDLMTRASQASELQVRAFVAGLQEENLQSMRDYLRLSAIEQKTYTENLLVDFSKWLQEQRNQDLTMFQMRINSIEQNAGMFQQETEQILASIISGGGMRKTQSN